MDSSPFVRSQRLKSLSSYRADRYWKSNPNKGNHMDPQDSNLSSSPILDTRNRRNKKHNKIIGHNEKDEVFKVSNETSSSGKYCMETRKAFSELTTGQIALIEKKQKLYKETQPLPLWGVRKVISSFPVSWRAQREYLT